MIVVDVNVIAHLVLRGEHSKACGKLFLQDSDWAAPRLWRDEMANVLVTYERNKLLGREAALSAFNDAEIVLRDNEYQVNTESILAIAADTQCSAYDSQYIALATELKLKLFTYDKKVLSNCPHLARRPENF